jgi:amidase
MTELFRLTAREAVRLLAAKEVSPTELVRASLDRIAATDGAVNAIPSLCAERALAHARRIESGAQRGAGPAWLGGLPIAVKDLNDVRGVRTTYGSPLFASNVPDGSDAMVETLEANGAIVIGKANAPEFGHGANTYNEVFGETRNPWNTAMTCGGSSGGSAVAVATGQAWLATGSDLGCSLRTPAAFCSVVGLRPSPGRVARSRVRLPFDNLWVQGPMARNVGDVALMLDAMAGVHPADPISFPAPAIPFESAIASAAAPRRVGYSRDLMGLTPVAREVAETCDRAVARLAGIGTVVEERCPDLREARDVFRVLRANQFVGDLAPIIDANRERVRKDVVWNMDLGKKATADAIGEAERRRGRLYARASAFFDEFDLLLTPAAIVPPFDVRIRALDEVEGVKLDNYYEWYAISYAITLTSLPALALPCGFTASGLPVALQLVGPPRGEARLLAFAHRMEEVFGIARRLPIDPAPPREPGAR